MKDTNVLGEGSFGCVVEPALPCKGKATVMSSQKGKQVSKIFSEKKYYDREVKTSRMAAKVDPSGKRLLLPTKLCTTTRKEIEDRPVIVSQCESISDAMDSYGKASKVFYQLQMPYGGMRLDHYVRENPTTKKEMLQMMKYAVDGLELLRKKGMCHQDIKSGNMLRKPSGEAIFIDYSLMIPLKDVYHEKNRRRWKYVYTPHPPEYYLTYMLHEGTCVDCHLVEKVLHNMKSFGKRWLQFQKYHKDLEKEVQELADWMESLPIGRILKTMAVYAGKMDIYSLGMVIVDLDRYVKKDVVWDRKHGRAYRELLHGMTHPDPRKRWDLKAIKERFGVLVG